MGAELTTCIQGEVEKLFAGLALEAQRQIPAQVQKKKKVIVLAGPTACGKSAFALQLSKKINGEIISGDSIQVYRGMNIGTAKPSLQDQAMVPHYLLDIRSVTEPFNVVDFYYEARHACQQILARGGVPIVVGGSGFYVHALLYGPPSGPPPVPELRRALEKEMDEGGSQVLYDRLAEKDPIYARSITHHDRQKIIRALEIITLTGKPVSRLSWKARCKPMNYDFRCWFFHRPREVLHARIKKRCAQMLEQGFLAEVESLIEQGIEQNTSAAQAIGYRQALEYLRGDRTPQEYQHFVTTFEQATRLYAKRQFTWFRKEPLFRWIDLEMDSEIVMDIIEQDYAQ